MGAADSIDDNIASKFLKTLEPVQVGAALSKLVAASIGDMVVVLSRSPAHNYYSLADIERMVLPPVAAGQFYIVEAMDKERGFRASVAAVTWASVLDEVDKLIKKSKKRFASFTHCSRQHTPTCDLCSWGFPAAVKSN